MALMKPGGRIALVAAMLAAAAGFAQPYRWVDEKGRVQYGDAPPAGARDLRKRELRAPSPEAAATLPFELARLLRDFPVTLYTSPGCKQPCELARAALNRRGIPFKEVQVWDAETNEELKRVSGDDVIPTLLVGRSAQRGFEQGLFDALLDSAGYPREGILPPRAQKAPQPPQGYVPAAAAETAKPVAKPLASEAPAALGRYGTPAPGEPARRRGAYALPGETAGADTPETAR